MKLAIIKSNLKEALLLAERAIGENLNLPILKNVLLEAENGKLKITGTNLEVAITYETSCKVIENGKLTVPAKIISSLIDNIPSDRLNLEKKENKLEIKTDNYQASIQGMPADDFPIMPKIKEKKNYLEIKSATLRNALNQVLIASQFSEIRPELNSVFFNFSSDNLKLAATDSFRLAESTISSVEINTEQKQNIKFLVPLKTAQELSRILKDGEAIKIYQDDNQILFTVGSMEFLSRLIDGNFPDYAAIIPKKFDVEVTVNREELMNAIKLASVFGSKNGEVKFKIKEGKKVIDVSAADQSVGENNYVLSAKIEGKLEEIIFNWKYVADGLKVMQSEEIFFGINGDSAPALIQSPNNKSFFYILKPIASA